MQEAEKGNFSFKWEKAIRMLGREGLNGYRDVEELRKQAEQRYEECRNAEEKERKAKERKNKRLTVAFVLVVLIACVVGWFVVTRVIPNNKYQRAVALRENGLYEDAIAAFAELGEYSDAAQQLSETRYQQATNLRAFGKYDEAIAVFASLNGYRDAETQIEEIKQEKYQQAVALREAGQYDQIYQPGQEGGFYHTHKNHEELYFVLSGKGEYQVDGVNIPLQEGSVVRVAPAGKRTIHNNGSEPLVVLCVQYRGATFSAEDATDGVILQDQVEW